jgi:hypothetical protein
MHYVLHPSLADVASGASLTHHLRWPVSGLGDRIRLSLPALQGSGSEANVPDGTLDSSDPNRRRSRTVAGTAQVFYMQRRRECAPLDPVSRLTTRTGKARVSTRRDPKIAQASLLALGFSKSFQNAATLTSRRHRPRLGAVFWCSRAVSLCAQLNGKQGAPPDTRARQPALPPQR